MPILPSPSGAVVGAVFCLAIPLVAQPEPVPVTEVLAIERVGGGGRSPVFTDALQAQLARGTFAAPSAGDKVAVPGGRERTWRRVVAGKDGAFPAGTARGGYAFAVVDADRARIAILAARGHSVAYVNGTPRGGDVYNFGITRVPVALRQGRNELLFGGGRGALRVTLEPPPAPVFLERRDATLPDVVVGQSEVVWAGVMVTNATEDWQRGLSVTVRVAAAAPVTTPLPALPPLSCRKVGVRIDPGAVTAVGEVTAALELSEGSGAVLGTIDLVLRARNPGDNRRCTFVSAIDGSVQYYGVRPRRTDAGDATRPGLILSLHGAGVEGIGQSACYEPKSWAVVVAPTNRRRFGFDWEDWGRMDALEVLADARRRLGTDPARTWLTGHSMGGHGTWNLGVQFPDRFAAIAPSAGWSDFWSYGGGVTWSEPTAVQEMLMRAANASRTVLMLHNTASAGVYVLHGDADRTVPVAQARAMRERLGTFHPDFAYHERPGAGHWWGNACVDWPPLMEFLRRRELPVATAVRRVEFTTVNPALSHRCFWVAVRAQRHSMQPSRVVAGFEPKDRSVTVTTENVARLGIDPRILPGRDRVGIEIDGHAVVAPWGGDDALVFERGDDGEWQVAAAEDPWHKNPVRAGPFKEAFANRLVFVYATGGDPRERSWAYAKARLDAEVFWYRGNGAVDLVPDTDFDDTTYAGRNVVLYGNADTNAAWRTLLDGCPITVQRGVVTVGRRRLEGDDLACLFTWPRARSETALVAVIAGTGRAGLRTTDRMRTFVSGAGFPDWLVVGADMLEKGSAGVRGAGFFGPDWSLESGDAAWADH